MTLNPCRVLAASVLTIAGLALAVKGTIADVQDALSRAGG